MNAVMKTEVRGVTHEPAAPALELKDVAVSYNARTNGALAGPDGQSTDDDKLALANISFTVKVGERVAVVGPNGAGKSTLFKVIAGTLKARTGVIHVYGRVPDRHICIAYVPQRSQIDWSFPVTVEDVVMMGRVGQIGLFRRPAARDREIVRASLERVRGLHLARKQIGELSGGQQQRVFIARALAQQAELLLLDEPFAGLDVPTHEAIFEILDSLRADSVTVLIATHDLSLAAERFDKIMLLNKQIVAFGPAAVVLQTNHLLQAYGGHVHVLSGDDTSVMLTDTCCDHGEQ